MDVYLSNKIIGDLQFNDNEIAAYVALKSLYISTRGTQVVSYNMLCYELYGNKNYKRSTCESVKDAFESLVERKLVVVKDKLSATEFAVDLNKLYFDRSSSDSNKVYYTVVRDDEIHTIMNINNKMNKFKLLRYFVTCLRTICRTQGIYMWQDAKVNFVGFMTQEYLCKEIGISYKSNFKLIQQYNDILEQNRLLYIYRHTELKRDKVTGQFKSFANHYGRYEDKNDIIEFATNYEKYCGVNEEIVQSEESNNKRRISAWYNNLCWDFDRFIKNYTSDELISIYKQVHHDNEFLEKEIAKTDEDTERYRNLLGKLRCEDIFYKIPCVVEYIHKRSNSSTDTSNSDIWGEPDPMDKPVQDYFVEEMPTMSDMIYPENQEVSNDGLIDIGSIFEEDVMMKIEY